jgi:Holliday junction resolvase RusA-like endonuclease
MTDQPCIVRFFVDERPIPQPRGRPCSVGDGTMRVIVSRKHPVNGFINAIRATALLAHRNKPPLQGPLRVDIDVILPRPKSMLWKTRMMPRVYQWAYKGPDKDNFEKVIFDSICGLLIVNDGQICDGRTRKFIAAGDERPGAWITVIPL